MSYNPTLIFNNTILVAGDMSGNLTTPSHDVSQANTLSIQCVWSGSTPVGVTALQASTDNVTFTTITNSPLAVTGNTGSNFYNVQNIGYRYIRAIYTFTSGTGSMTISLSAKFQ